MQFNFIIPSWSYWKEPTRAQPLTQLYLATILKNQGHRVQLTDLRDGPKEIEEADAYFYTVASPDFDEVRGLVKDITKKHKFHTLHIAGGPHPTLFPEESKKIFNSIAIGRGEESIKKMVFDIYKGDLRKEYNEPTKGDYPFPRREFLSRDKIVTSLFKTEDIPSTTVLFSHGCPHLCSFCANYNRQPIERRTLDSISKEIDYLKSDYRIEGLSLQDEICIPPKGETEFLDLMKSKYIMWRGQTRAGVKEETIKQASRSGCLELSIGLESVDPNVLRFAKKGINVEMARDTLIKCRENGIKTRVYLLNGLPGEPDNIVEMTKKFIDEAQPDVVLLSSLQPYPGSDIYNNPRKYGIKYIDKKYSKYNHLRCRFKDSNDLMEDVVPFEYEKGFTRERIMSNLLNLQEFLRDRGMNK